MNASKTPRIIKFAPRQSHVGAEQKIKAKKRMKTYTKEEVEYLASRLQGKTEREIAKYLKRLKIRRDLDREDLVEIQSLMEPYYIANKSVTYAVVKAGCVKESEEEISQEEVIIRFASEVAAKEFLENITGKYTHFIVQQFHDGKSWQDMEETVRWAYDW